MDLTNSLKINQGKVVGIVRAELMQARILHELDPKIKYSILTKYGFKEVPSSELKWLFKSKNIGDDYVIYQKKKKSFLFKLRDKINHYIEKKLYKYKRKHRNKNIPKKFFINYPYKNGDLIFSCGWMGTQKEDFFSRVKQQGTKVKLVYTIYDLVLIKENLRHYFSPYDISFEKYLQWIAENCSAIIYGGKTAKQDAETYFEKNNISYPEGYSIKFGGNVPVKSDKSKDAQILQNLQISSPYVLAVGSFDHKKNYRVLYQAFCMLKAKNTKDIPQLVIVGRDCACYELKNSFLENPLTKDLVKIVNCTDKELDVLYRNCSFALLPSFYEGYSVVLPETLGYGKFCICSDVAPLREVAKDLVTYVNPYHPKEWADNIEKYFRNETLLKQKEEKIIQNWHAVSWDESVKGLYTSLQKIMKAPVQKDVQQKMLKQQKSSKKDKDLYLDIGLITHNGNISGIPKTQFLLARNLYHLQKNIKFFMISNGQYFEFPSTKLQHILETENIDVAVSIDRNSLGNLSDYETALPFEKGDVVFSAGSGYDPKTEELLITEHKRRGFLYSQIIYDLTPIIVPHTHPNDRVAYYPKFLKNTFEMSDVIFYGGKTAQRDGVEFQSKENLPIKESYVLKFGCDTVVQPFTQDRKQEVLDKYGITKDFLLTVGTIEARKNQETLYEAYLELMKLMSGSQELPQLVICGRNGWKAENLKYLLSVDKRVKNKVQIISPSDDELNILYSCCKFTLLASLYEGWSLTLPESLCYGKFCLCSDVDPLKETGENFVEYVNPYDPEEWAKKIHFYLTHPKELQNKEKSIRDKWKKITWQQCANELHQHLSKMQEEK